MSNRIKNKSTRVSVDEIPSVAAQGVKRALEARNAAGVTLTEEELKQVSGGMLNLANFYSRDYFPHGIIRPDWLRNNSIQQQFDPALQFGPGVMPVGK